MSGKSDRQAYLHADIGTGGCHKYDHSDDDGGNDDDNNDDDDEIDDDDDDNYDGDDDNDDDGDHHHHHSCRKHENMRNHSKSCCHVINGPTVIDWLYLT